SHIDDRCNCEESFAWEQRHVLEKRRCEGMVRVEVSYYIREECPANRPLAAGLFSFRRRSGGTEAPRGTLCCVEIVPFNKLCLLNRRDDQLGDAHAARNDKFFRANIGKNDL